MELKSPLSLSVEKASPLHDLLLVPKRQGDRCPRSLGRGPDLLPEWDESPGGASCDVPPLPPAHQGCLGKLPRSPPVGRCASLPAAGKVILFQEVLSAKGSCPALSYNPRHSLQFSGRSQPGYRAMQPLT